MQGDTARVSRLVDQAMSAVTRCTELVNQMLMFARRQVMRPRTADLNQLISDFAPLIRHAAGPDILLTLDLSADPTRVRIDRQQFEAALLNLVMNSRDAISGEGWVVIETRNVAGIPGSIDDSADA